MDILFLIKKKAALKQIFKSEFMLSLFKKYKNKTIIFISHRVDNMDLFDQVVKIEKGKLISDVSKN